MEANILKKAKEWLADPLIDRESRREIENLFAHHRYEELNDRFYRDLEFGTGGMRGKRGAGINRINRYTISKAVKAIAEEILSCEQNPKRVAVAYDTRIGSRELAMESTQVFSTYGIQSFIFANPVSVSLLSFCIRYRQTAAGVMITASHNPPEYNGIKVFWSDGAQVTSPVDLRITNRYKSLSYCAHSKDSSQIDIVWEDREVEEAYFSSILSKTIHPDLCRERGDKLSIVYTALHGTGWALCTRVLKEMGFSRVERVKEQDSPDGNFPTVDSPNPEDPQALKMAVELMKEKGADMALGTDPDADRVGLALIHKGEEVFLSGNQIGVLMLYYILSEQIKKNMLPLNPYVVTTIVTTPLIEVMADHFGVDLENTLTGFKWIGRRIFEIEKTQPHRNFLFAVEESFGYLHHDFARDKDGVSAVGLLCEIGLFYKDKGHNLVSALDQIYEQFGFFGESLISLTYPGEEGARKIVRMMDYFRNIKSELFGLKISKQLDYLQESKISQKSNVLAFFFSDDGRLYLRPSGTEPKIKFYLMGREIKGSLEEKKIKVETRLKRLEHLIRMKAREL